MEFSDKFLVAVASTDNRIINQHFGHAERFLIYLATPEQIDFVEERAVDRYCFGADTYDHPFEEERFMKVADTIKDCRYVLVSRIGGAPERKLVALGISPVIMYEYIEEGIRKLITE